MGQKSSSPKTSIKVAPKTLESVDLTNGTHRGRARTGVTPVTRRPSVINWQQVESHSAWRQTLEYHQYVSSEKGKRDKKDPLISTADFLRFLKQRTGWMGQNGCLVPPDYCHEYNDLKRSPFSIALEKANDYLANQGLRPDQPLSPEAESRIMDNWPPELETLRGLATVKGLVLPV